MKCFLPTFDVLEFDAANPSCWKIGIFYGMIWKYFEFVTGKDNCQFGGKWEFRIFNQTFRILFGQLRKSRRTKIAELFE
jgi:hypothetical protein